MDLRIFLRTASLAMAILPMFAHAQVRYAARSGEISFRSSTPLETIEAVNRKATSVFDATTGNLQFAVLIKGFEFEKALMQEHFNENYMESNTYPKSTFTGKMTGISADQMATPGRYAVEVSGDLTMHGVTRQVSTKGTVVVAGAVATAESEFEVDPTDHGIAIPGVVRGKIAERVLIKVRIPYSKL